MSKSMHSAMEQSRYWMWGTRKSMCSDPRDDSWEERAFAADAAGGLNGYTWPPRSYSCSFCRKEFNSAQALGGHMNVHRRDRARLKASSPSNYHEEEESGGGYPLHLPLLPLVYDSNPNFNVVSPLTSQSTSKVDSSNKDAELRHKHSILSSPGPFDLTLGMGCSYRSVKKRVRDEVAEESWIPLNEKRPRILESSDDCDRHQPTVPKLCHSTKEELDLELRLGERPKVK